MSWLRETFPVPGDDSIEVQRVRYARAYILQIIGGYLILDKSRNLAHLRWLLKLIDFRAAGELSWGSAVLVTLYREMCRATQPNKIKIGGFLALLQSWVRFRFPFLRPRVNHLYTFPLVTRWNHSPSYRGIPTALEDIRLLLDQRSEAHSNPYMYPFSTPMPSWNVWPGASHFPMTPTQPTIYTPSSQAGLHEAPLGSSTHFQYPAPWVMQTPTGSLFYQGGSSSQRPQSEADPEQPQP
ncbi:hypothetical protein Golob_025329 [Gossypium lobatum]|uniref:Aminotransferase-like plant mobile domain-containing protein n=1 Tax=Gossypium lobatum TaxID=34289 RepID=A0A7J8NHY7_9ROSI|nr:hypothetical protein [Gossypium lobatum]